MTHLDKRVADVGASNGWAVVCDLYGPLCLCCGEHVLRRADDGTDGYMLYYQGQPSTIAPRMTGYEVSQFLECCGLFWCNPPYFYGGE